MHHPQKRGSSPFLPLLYHYCAQSDTTVEDMAQAMRLRDGCAEARAQGLALARTLFGALASEEGKAEVLR